MTAFLDIGLAQPPDAATPRWRAVLLGIDLSAQMLEHARRVASGEGLADVGFEQADAQVHAFPAGRFDVAISGLRGSMFFDDPVAAFGNIGHALRSGGRLVLMVWQARERNAWWTKIREAIAGDAELRARERPERPFSLGDLAEASGILTAAGFTRVSFTDVHEPVYYGPDVGVALNVVSGLAMPRDLLAGMDEGTAENALERLRATLAAHLTGEGVLFDARTWIIAARRP